MNARSTARAFTLVELLAAMIVLSILALATVMLIGATDRSASLSSRGVDAAIQSRVAFDRIDLDLRALIKRPDVTFEIPTAQTGATTDLIRFVSSVTSAAPAGVAATSNRNISIVAYQVSADADNGGRLSLLRGAKSLQWSDTGFFGLRVSDGLPIPGLPTSFQPSLPADYDVLAAGVFRMVIGFQLYPDNQPATLADGTAVSAAQGQTVYSPPTRTLSASGTTTSVTYVDCSRISALLVGLVAVDLNTLRVTNASEIAALAQAFPAPANGVLPVQAWFSIASNPSAMPTAVPLPVRQAVRVFERFYPVTPYGTKGGT